MTVVAVLHDGGLAGLAVANDAVPSPGKTPRGPARTPATAHALAKLAIYGVGYELVPCSSCLLDYAPTPHSHNHWHLASVEAPGPPREAVSSGKARTRGAYGRDGAGGVRSSSEGASRYAPQGGPS
jgi:hypothetical protein